MAEAIVQRCRAAKVVAVNETAEDKKVSPPRLFNLTALQREANTRYGMSAQRTLDVAQALYETHKVLSYPRTDATALPEDYLDTVHGLFAVLAQGELAPFATRAIENNFIRLDKRIFDNTKISDHFAIIPTLQRPSALSEDEKRIYDLVARRFIAAFYPHALFKKTIRMTVVGVDTFKSNGSVLAEPGWMEVNGREVSDDFSLTLVAAGELPSVDDIATDAKKTKPPKRFNDATLLAAMESAGKRVDDEELREELKECGLGTPATRAATIEGLLLSTEKKAPYLVRDGKELVPTDKGMKMIAFLIEQNLDRICSPAMTGEWEKRLRLMEKGQYTRPQFMSEIESVTHELIVRLRQQAAASPQVAAAKMAEPCPNCAGEVREEVMFFACGGCTFKAWKVMAKRRISRAEVAQLLGAGKTELLSGFTSAKDKPFKAHLVYNRVENKVDYEFPNSGIPCPDCGKPLIHHSKPASGRRKGYSFFGCSGYPACTASFEDARGKPGNRSEKRKRRHDRARQRAARTPLAQRAGGRAPSGRGLMRPRLGPACRRRPARTGRSGALALAPGAKSVGRRRGGARLPVGGEPWHAGEHGDLLRCRVSGMVRLDLMAGGGCRQRGALVRAVATLAAWPEHRPRRHPGADQRTAPGHHWMGQSAGRCGDPLPAYRLRGSVLAGQRMAGSDHQSLASRAGHGGGRSVRQWLGPVARSAGR
ncbi:DNA topoisomerase [Cupriavidus basilensis]